MRSSRATKKELPGIVSQSAKSGIRLSTPDALIAAQALNRRARLLTTDGDFLPLAPAAGLKRR